MVSNAPLENKKKLYKTPYKILVTVYSRFEKF